MFSFQFSALKILYAKDGAEIIRLKQQNRHITFYIFIKATTINLPYPLCFCLNN